MMARKGFKLVGACLLGYLIINGLLGNMPFASSFSWNLIYSYTVMIIIAITSAYWGVKLSEATPTFIDGFKFIAKRVLLFSLGVSLITPLLDISHTKQSQLQKSLE